jgi:hypothetical protein
VHVAVDLKTQSGYGSLSAEMAAVLVKYVQGRIIWALGSGPTLSEPRLLIQAGAARVYAVDKARRGMHPEYLVHDRIVECRAYSDEFIHADPEVVSKPDVVFMKWPDTVARWAPVFAEAPIVIYIGCNRRATACGHPSVWQALFTRPILHVIEDEQNDLIVYGAPNERTQTSSCREEQEVMEAWNLKITS